MHFSLVTFVVVVILSSDEFSESKPWTDLDMLSDADSEEIRQMNEDPDIEEIANREYETTHGRILAVNMAHLEKRKQAALRYQEAKGTVNETNVFEHIEKDNEAHHIEGLYEGDIIIDEDLEELLHLPHQTRTKRNAVRSRKRLWLSRIIPYKLTSGMMHIKSNLLTAIADFHKHTCLRFVPYRHGVHRDYIYFNTKSGCSSKVGRHYVSAGGQAISLGSGCNYHGTIKHELLHALGFWHEQSRADRDKFVSIKWENIAEGAEDQFIKLDWRDIDQLGLDYDYQSIMHYSRTSFSKNGKPTIVAVGNEKMKFGTKNRLLSTKDIIEINALYDCQTTRYGWTKWSEFTPCDKDCFKSRNRYCYHSGNPKVTCGGNVNVYGIEKDRRKCSKLECLAKDAINGHWGHWGAWTTCSASCDEGARSRTRLCNNPPPSKYGKPCKGEAQQEELCTVGRCHLGAEDTEFEDPRRPLGVWRNKQGARLKWIRHQFFTKTMDTGPMYDHTKGTAKGHYLYMESSYPAKPWDKAILTSNTLTAKMKFQCFKFYYTMYGHTMGSLEVRLYRPGLPRTTLFYKRGNQGKPWHLGMATIAAKTTFALEIVATVGKTGYSDIAIDDMYLDDGKCSCQDKYMLCKKWSAKGECTANEAWMKKNCPRSCSICGIRSTASSMKECKDTNTVQCPLWAKKGECDKNKIYMHKNCPKSCKICTPKDCKDSNTVQCPLWAEKGECDKNKIYMLKHCAKSCKICKAPECKDKYKDCPKRALKSDCTLTKTRKWMQENCKKSCNVCVCADNHPRCSSWARTGECKANQIYMNVNCKKSCNKCNE